MTRVRISNSIYYMQLNVDDAEEDIVKEVNSFPIPKPRPDWGTIGPERKLIDFLNITKQFTISCTITKDDNYTSGWVQSPLASASLVKDRIVAMTERGGTVLLEYGISADGFTVLHTYNVAITKLKVKEKGDDFEPGTVGVPAQYSCSMTLLRGDDM